MTYEVIVTRQAQQDLDDHVGYIAEKFGMPDTASNKYNKIMRVLRQVLPDHPHWLHTYSGNPWRQWYLYIYNEDNYRIIHVPDDDHRRTTVIRILHRLQDIPTQLRRTDISELW